MNPKLFHPNRCETASLSVLVHAVVINSVLFQAISPDFVTGRVTLLFLEAKKSTYLFLLRKKYFLGSPSCSKNLNLPNGTEEDQRSCESRYGSTVNVTCTHGNYAVMKVSDNISIYSSYKFFQLLLTVLKTWWQKVIFASCKYFLKVLIFYFIK